jgi:hypothetical protein
MFKFFVVFVLCVLAFKACSADVNIVTAHVPMMDKSYIYYNVNGHRDVITVPFELPLKHWSW